MHRFLLVPAVAAAAFATPCAAQDVDTAFSGFRLEALGGYDHVSGNGEGQDGFVYGGAVGYDAALGRARLGAEAEITGSTLGDDDLIKVGRDLYLGVRAGYVLSPAAMLYLKAGYTNARVTGSYTAGETTVRESVNLDGFRLGAGMEVALSPRFYVKGEYRYSHYGDQDDLSIDADRHQLLAGIGARF